MSTARVLFSGLLLSFVCFVCAAGSPPASGSFRVWALGDSGTGTYEAQAVLDAYRSLYTIDSTDLMLQLGDNAVRAQCALPLLSLRRCCCGCGCSACACVCFFTAVRACMCL